MQLRRRGTIALDRKTSSAQQKQTSETQRADETPLRPGTAFRGLRSPPSARLTFLLLFLARSSAVWLQAPVLDCDETFNYWEPTHLLLHGRGLQTWEYSPEFGLRSYLYPLLHAVWIRFLQLLAVDHVWGKAGLFFGLRLLFAVVSSYCEAEFVQAAVFRYTGPHRSSFGAKLGWVFLSFLVLSSGLWHASIAFLPQTFTMYCIVLCWSAWLRGHYHAAIWWMGCASLLGWPFSAILGLTSFAFDILATHGFRIQLFRLARTALLTISLLVSVSLLVDYYFYRRWILAVLNIALYNSSTSGDASRGSALYGVESWDFYFRNLFLNFNLLLPVALLGPPLLLGAIGVLQLCSRRSKVESSPASPTARLGLAAFRILDTYSPFVRISILTCIPVYTWIAIFSSMPHKEERFMFVIYPLICFTAALPVTALCFATRFPIRKLRNGLGVLFLICFGLLSISRSASLLLNYRAPLRVYQELEAQAQDSGSPLYRQILSELSTTEDLPEFTPVHVCVGKEWYRFPNHFLLPDICVARVSSSSGSQPSPEGAVPFAEGLIAFPLPCWRLPSPWRSGASTTVQLELQFLKSGFGGQLPQHYITSSPQYRSLLGEEPPHWTSWMNGSRFPIYITTGLLPPHMNDENLAEPSRYFDLERCNFLVDLDLTISRTDEDPDLASHNQESAKGSRWRVIHRQPFLDAERSPSLPRAFYFPIPEWISSLKFAEYQLLERCNEAEPDTNCGPNMGV